MTDKANNSNAVTNLNTGVTISNASSSTKHCECDTIIAIKRYWNSYTECQNAAKYDGLATSCDTAYQNQGIYTCTTSSDGKWVETIYTIRSRTCY